MSLSTTYIDGFLQFWINVAGKDEAKYLQRSSRASLPHLVRIASSSLDRLFCQTNSELSLHAGRRETFSVDV